MAAKGEDEPQMHLVKEGTSRRVIESQLGMPVSRSVLKAGGSVCEYDYELGNRASTNRAVGHAVVDVLTLGVWEVFASGYELSRGTKYRATVEYDSRDVARAVTIQEFAPAAPSPAKTNAFPN
jgi:hypothetical protein